MSTADSTYPNAHMVKVSPKVSNGPRVTVDNGAGDLFVYNQTTDVVSIPAFEANRLLDDEIVS